MTFTSTKVRSGPDIEFTSSMNWDTLKLGPSTKQKPSGSSGEDDDDDSTKVKNMGKKKKTKSPKREDSDMPW
jgi:hypothetical protein